MIINKMNIRLSANLEKPKKTKNIAEMLSKEE